MARSKAVRLDTDFKALAIVVAGRERKVFCRNTSQYQINCNNNVLIVLYKHFDTFLKLQKCENGCGLDMTIPRYRHVWDLIVWKYIRNQYKAIYRSSLIELPKIAARQRVSNMLSPWEIAKIEEIVSVFSITDALKFFDKELKNLDKYLRDVECQIEKLKTIK